MKVLISRSSQGTIGGAELSSSEHAKALMELGHQVVFVSSLSELKTRFTDKQPDFYKSLWPYQDYGNFRLLYYVFSWPIFLLHYIYIMLIERPDAVMAHSSEDQIVFGILKNIFRKTCYIIRDPADLRNYLHDNNRSPVAKFHRKLMIYAIKKADFTITLNNEEKKIIAKESKVDPAKILVKGSNILFSNFDLNSLPPEKPKNILVIGTIIRFTKDKNVACLIDAFKQLPGQDELELWLIGDGPEMKNLEDSAIKHKNIKFAGRQANISSYLNGIDIFVQPAKIEGWGRNVKEAMYFEKPVIGASIGGIKLQIKDNTNGLLFDPSSPDDLKSKLELLINKPGLRKLLAKAAKQKALDDGDFVDDYKKFYLPLIERTRK